MAVVEIELPFTFPSVNQHPLGGGLPYHRLKKKLGKQTGEWVDLAMLQGLLPRTAERVHVTATMRFPRHPAAGRKRDEGNFRAWAEKVIGDVIESRGILTDDNADRYTFGRLTFDPDTGPARTVLTLEVAA